MCAPSVSTSTAILALIRQTFRKDKVCGDWGDWGKWSDWGDPVGCTFGVSAKRARVRSRSKQCQYHQIEICQYAATYLGPGEDEWTYESVTLENDLGAVGQPFTEVEDEYEYEYQFCFFTTALADIIGRSKGEYVVGLSATRLPELVAGHKLVANVGASLASRIRSQSYALDGEPVSLPTEFVDLEEGPHVFTGEVINTSGAKFRILFPFVVVPRIACCVSETPAEAISTVSLGRGLIVQNHEIHPVRVRLEADSPASARARLVPAELTIPARSQASVRVEIEPRSGTLSTKRLEGSLSVKLSSGRHSTQIALPVPSKELFEHVTGQSVTAWAASKASQATPKKVAPGRKRES